MRLLRCGKRRCEPKGKSSLSCKILRFAIIILAGLSTALGSVVLFGWYTHNITLIQVSPTFVPMQYNTAIGFLFCGLGILSLSFGFKRVAMVLAGIAGSLGFLTLCQYIFGVDFGIDQLLMKHYITVQTSHPGRMAPNTAICFSLSGLALLIKTNFKRLHYCSHIVGLLGSIVIALGIVAFSGYFSGIDTAYGWGNLTRMAIHTSSGFVVVGIAIFAFVWNEDMIEKAVIIPRWVAFPIGIGAATASTAMWQALRASANDHSEASALPLIVLVFGLVMSFLLAVTIWFAQKSWSTTQEIKKANEDLSTKTTSINKLNAINQQLTAAEQQLKAANQQFNASNQQLRASQQQLRAQDEQLHKLNYNLTERVKELNCLYGISEIVEKPGISLDGILQQAVDIIPHSWQYPESTCAQITLNGQQFATSNFKQTQWKQVSNIVVNNEKIGEIQVCYLQQQPESHEGPFLKEERLLIDAVAERLGDIIERRQAEKKSNVLKQRMEFILGSTKTGLDIIDSNLNMVYIDQEWAKLYGDPKGRKCYEYFMGRDEACPGCGAKKALETKTIVITEEVMVKEGNRSVQITTIPFQNEDGEWQVAEVNMDITENKKTEHEMKMLSKLPGENPNPVLRVNSDGTVLYSNPAGKLLLGNWGCDVGEKIPEKWQKLVAEALKSATNSSAAEEEEEEEEEVNGKIYLLTIAPILDANYVNIYARNITEYKQSFEKLEYAKELAEAANEAKGQFLANMSHEIRTPMNSIIGFSDILIEEQMPDDQKEYVSLIRESGRHLLELINDILDFSKVEAGKLDCHEIVFSLPEFVETVEAAMRSAAEKKGLKFEIVNCKQLPQQIRSDPNRLRQCLLNLVGNAIKFTDNGCVQVEVSLEDNDDKQFIRFDVEDTGIGIPADSQKKIFESFRQVDGTDSRQYGGTGLGLTITKQMAELLGGEISVKSEFGKGSIFSLVIPTNVETGFQELLENVEEDIQLDDNPKDPGHIEFTGRVLVAEDVLTNQKLMKHLLEKIGFEVTMVDDGNKVVQKALSQSFDLIFMDIQMPNMNGYEATKIIRDNSIKTPIIALTANAMSGDDVNCISAGCDGYLSKPIARQNLIDKISQYMSPSASPETIENIESQVDELANLCCEQVCEERLFDEKDNNMASEEVINFDQLISRLGDEELIKEVIPIFLKDGQERFEKLQEAVLSKDSEAIKFYAHAIKGAGRNVGATLLSDIAGQLESIGREGDLESADSIYGKLKTEYEKVVSFLSQPDWIETAKTNNGKKDKDNRPLVDSLKR